MSHIFNGINDPRRSNAVRHDLHEMLIIALLTVISGGETCADMVEYGKIKKKFLLEFIDLQHGTPNCGAFSDLFNSLDSVELGIVPARLSRSRRRVRRRRVYSRLEGQPGQSAQGYETVYGGPRQH